MTQRQGLWIRGHHARMGCLSVMFTCQKKAQNSPEINMIRWKYVMLLDLTLMADFVLLDRECYSSMILSFRPLAL